MEVVTILLIAFGLAMDAFAVSITSGVTIKSLKVNYALRIALFFGLFQAVMPGIGWLAGFSLRDIISGIDHWIAFGLLSLIGCKMIFENKIEIIGGLTLIAIGIKILIEHLVLNIA
jgi:putative Mn2+ efflux pump MntP